MTPNIEFYNEDCIELMKRYPDNYFDLAIVDPPYGINMDGGKIGGDNLGKAKKYSVKNWDEKPPNNMYFQELMRVSNNQIIWGANHFISEIPFNSSCWIVWDKLNSGGFADCELAWTSFQTAVRKFEFRWNGMIQGDMRNKEIRIHPTQKPVALYKWLLKNYAKQGDKILDTHGGSMSSAIACYDMGFDLVITELDKDYYEQALKRFNNHTAQCTLFTPQQLNITQ
jgi:site-specific DNA-methyltransferase (adenine-specific)